jgi:hypothetical protein
MNAKQTFTHELAHLIMLASYPDTPPHTISVPPRDQVYVTVLHGIDSDGAVAVCGDWQLRTDPKLSMWRLWHGTMPLATEREPLIAICRFWEGITKGVVYVNRQAHVMHAP